MAKQRLINRAVADDENSQWWVRARDTPNIAKTERRTDGREHARAASSDTGDRAMSGHVLAALCA